MYQEIRRLAAYAASSANFLTNIITKKQTDLYGWEVSENPFLFL